jgi:ferritin heavy chain
MCIQLSYMYESMAYYFDRDDVALKGFARFFYHNSTWDMEEFAEKLMKYINKRGGSVQLQNIDKPNRDEWGTPRNSPNNKNNNRKCRKSVRTSTISSCKA